MEFLWDNAKWVFSGIGVLIVTGVYHLFRSRRKAPVPAAQDIHVGASSPMSIAMPSAISLPQPPKEIRVPERGRFDHKAVLHEGDYIQYIRWPKDIRITIKCLITEDKESKSNGQSLRAEIVIDSPGDAILRGKSVEQLEYNRFLMPVKSSLYHYSVNPGSFWFYRFLIDHINPHSRQITLDAFFFKS